MTVSLCIREMMIQSVWKNLTGLQKAAEHLWCDFKWAKNSSPNTNDLYIHYMDKSTGTPPSLEEKKAFPNCGNKDGNIIHVLKHCISTSVAIVLKCLYPYAQVTGVWWWVFGSFKVTPEVFSCFLQTSQVLPHWLNHHFSYTQRHCNVRIEKGSVQTVAIKLETHNSLEYHYMLKH